jgi:hypothetical protein
MKLYIVVARNRENNYTLLHKPAVALNDGALQQRGCCTYEILDYLKSAGVSDEEIDRARTEIEEKGQTALESTRIVDADLGRVLEPVEGDLGRPLEVP